MNKKIVIIGAGAAGIAAATKLLANGFQNLVILEAESRIGGRIHTIPFGKNVLDLGAQWCHGQKDNVVYNLAKHHDLLEYNKVPFESFNMIRSDGSTIDRKTSDELMGLVMRLLHGFENEMKLCQGSLGSFVMSKYVYSGN